MASSLNKQMIRRQLVKESLGEELRVLYVALTRAKEKLILTGTVSKMEKLMYKLARYRDSEEELLSMETRMK
ncbi:3'-5' exonuclease, partial [Acinetobacter baumannii]|nr:3'-5' exonuclease [Acinetobacter baumannii]